MIRTLATGAVTLGVLLTVAPVAIVACWLTRSVRPIYAGAFAAVRLVLRVAGIKAEVEGLEHLDAQQTYLFVANHRSNVDPLLLLVVIGRNIRALGKASLFRLPVFGWVLRTARFVPVHRQDREQAIRAVDLAAEGLASGHDFLVFGEGTRSRDGKLLPFKKGPFVMAIKANVPVVPVALRGTEVLQAKGSFWIRPGTAHVRFLPPVSTDGLTFADRAVLRDTVRQRIADALPAAG